MAIGCAWRSKISKFAAALNSANLTRKPICNKEFISPFPLQNRPLSRGTRFQYTGLGEYTFCNNVFLRLYHVGRPRGSLWRGKKLIGKEVLFGISGMKRFKENEDKLNNFIKTHVLRLLKMDMVAVLNELERQQQVSLAVKVFWIVQKQDWYKPDVYLYKDLIIALARCKEMDEAMQLWGSMKKEDLFPDSQTYTEVIRGVLSYGSPADAMNIYEDMKRSPDPPDELPFRILLKGLLPHPLLRNKVMQDFEEIFPDQHVYD